MTNAAKVFPRTTRLSYIMFCGAIFLKVNGHIQGKEGFRRLSFQKKGLHIFSVGVSIGTLLVGNHLRLGGEAKTTSGGLAIEGFHLIVLFYIKS